MAEATYVKYTAFPGVVAERIITAKDFEENGAPGTPDLVFNRGNRYMINATEMGLSDEALQVLREDGGFTISGSDRAPRLAGNTEGAGTSAPTPSVAEGNEGSLGDGTVTTATSTPSATRRR